MKIATAFFFRAHNCCPNKLDHKFTKLNKLMHHRKAVFYSPSLPLKEKKNYNKKTLLLVQMYLDNDMRPPMLVNTGAVLVHNLCALIISRYNREMSVRLLPKAIHFNISFYNWTHYILVAFFTVTFNLWTLWIVIWIYIGIGIDRFCQICNLHN